MNLESTLTWPLSCPKDGVHLCPRHVSTRRRERLDLKCAIIVLHPATADPARRAVPAGTALPPDGSVIGAMT